MAGYTPEEIAALRSKLAGDSSVGSFDKKASDVSASMSRLKDHPFVSGIASSANNPLGPVLHMAAEDAESRGSGGVSDLSKKTQAALADQVTSPGGTILRPLDSPVPDVEAAPSLKDQLLSKLRGGSGGDPLASYRESYLLARRKQLGDYDTDKQLAGQMGNQQASHVMGTSALHDDFAARQEREAQLQKEADAKAHQEHQSFLARNTELADDIAKQKIDPKRLFKSMGTGERVAHVLGASLSGFASGFRGGPNDFLDRFDKQVAQDIQAQIDETDNKKAQLGARQTLFGQMLSESGDHRLAAYQTRNLMYEAAKQHIAAEDARLGIPELSTGAQQKISAIQHQQDQLNTQMSAESLQQKQQQMAAAAAARAHAEQQAWQRQKEVFEMGLKKDQLEIDRAKVAGGSFEDLNKQAQSLGDKLAAPELAQGRAAVDNAKRRLASAGPNEGLPGVGRAADLREKLAGRPEGIAALVPQNYIINTVAGLSDEERVSRGDWEKVKLAYRKQITGSGGSAEEMKVIENAFEGAKTPAEQRNAIAEADAVFKQIEARHKAGVDPRALQLYESRLQGQAGIAPKGDADALRRKLQ